MSTVLFALVPRAPMDPAPMTLVARMRTMPPPAAPEEARPLAGVPVQLLVAAAPPPPPRKRRDGETGIDMPPKPPASTPGGVPGVQPKPPLPPMP